jgi:hypothetical protein
MTATWTQTLTAFPGLLPLHSYDHFRPQKYQKAESKEFAGWYGSQSKAVKEIIRPLKANRRWAKVKYTTEIEAKKRELCTHRYILCIDPQSSYAGNLYNEDVKAILYAKFAVSIPWRFVHMGVKTLYHFTLIGVARAIFDGVRKKNPPKAFAQRIVRTVMDIVRTPLYESIMLIVAVTALLTAPFKPTLLYDYRAFTGDLARALFWGRRPAIPENLTPCMFRLRNMMDFEKNRASQKIHKEICYRDLSNATLVGLDNLAYTLR